MQVNSVSSNNIQSFGHRRRPIEREMLEGFANLNDKQLQQIAFDKADEKFNDKKYRRTQNRFFYSIPIVGALASALTSTHIVRVPEALAKAENAKRIGKFIADRARSVKFNHFVGAAALGTAAFATFDLIFAGKRQLEKKNKTARNFAQNHPFLSLVSGLAVTAGAILAGGMGISKLAGKASSKPSISTLRTLVKGKNFINNNKVLNKASKLVSKAPEIVKTFAKSALNFAPWLLVLGSLTKSISYSTGKTKEVYKNYEQLKTAQAQARDALALQDAVLGEE